MKILIWQVRNMRKLTLTELSKLSGISKSTLNDYENEKTEPKMSTLEKIAVALNVRITDLYESEYK